ncbi:MAG: hypothetical protein JWQ06_994 [Mucilaginibacter sp.]|nr:hypothetical protein [Mucilaginibacter sp.]
MNIKTLFLFGCMAMLFASCSKVYSPALYHHDIAYQPKPTSFDTAKTANYISAAFSAYPSANFNNTLVGGQINLSRGHVFNNFNLAYGAFGAFGDYQNGTGSKTSATYFADKLFGAVGGRMSANFFTTAGNADIRFIGMEAAYSHEFGSYADYRKSVVTLNQPNLYVDQRTDLFTVGLTTEVIFHNRNNTLTHGIRGFLGTTIGHNPLSDTYYTNDSPQERFFRNIFPEASYFIKFKNYFGTVEIGNQFFIRFGLSF